MIRGSSVFLSILVLWTIAVGHRGGCEAYSFLFKFKETFKLAEIQNMEATLQIRECSLGFKCDLNQLLVDRATGSSLFRLDLQRTEDESFASNGEFVLSPESRSMIQSRLLSLSSLQRCDWIGEILEEGCDAAEIVENLKSSQNAVHGIEQWNLDYVKLVGDTASKQTKAYTMKSVLCSVAHELPSRPSLNPAMAKDTLLVVDTTKAHETDNDASSCFLVRCMDHPSHKSVLQELEWAQRPFQYSSAVSAEVAEMVMELLLTLCQTNNSSTKRNILLDPTCGSGTFLALAIANGFSVEGCDINPSVVDGAIRNLKYAFGEERVREYARVETHDSCDERQLDAETISCVVANLPWVRMLLC